MGLRGPLTLSAPRSDQARWITALTHKERQERGPPNKGGEHSPHRKGPSPFPALVGESLGLEGEVPSIPLSTPQPAPRVTCPGEGP